MARMQPLYFAVLWALLPPPADAELTFGGDFFKTIACWFGNDRCGFLGFAVKLHKGYPKSAQCEERCLYFPSFSSYDYSCGGCGSLVTEPPATPSPVVTSVLEPTSTPLKSTSNPVKVPTPAPAATDNPTEGPITSTPIGAPVALTAAPVVSVTEAPIQFSSAPVVSPSVAPTPASEAPSVSPTDTTVPTGDFNITIEIVGEEAGADASLFTQAMDRWESVITGDLLDKSGTGLDISEFFPTCTVPSSVDDVFLCAEYQVRDGRGGTLAVAGPLYVRDSEEGGLPYVGGIIVDSADVSRLRAKEDLFPVILHEMGHILGIGTLWSELGVTGSPTANCPYNGPNANREYADISGCAVVPTETNGTINDGTFCTHWDEECMRTELMTGRITGDLPMSRITIGTLEDMGYNVDYSKADAYGESDLGSGCTCRRRKRSILEASHGETRQLGRSRLSTIPQRMSEKMRQYAIDVGTSILDDRTVRSRDKSKLEKATWVGSEVVSVVVADGEGIFSVVVKSMGRR